MLTTFLMLAVVADQPQVTATFAVTAPNPDAIIAEQIKNPGDTPPETFAEKLVEAEGLTSWSDQDPISSHRGANLAWKARRAANGREVIVYYSPSAPTVCRIRRERGGISKIHQQAVRWCAASLGITLPSARPHAGNN